MGEVVRYGIIGSGMMGLEHLRNLQAIEGAVVTAVADPHGPSRDWATALAAEVGEDLTCFEHHGALIESGLCDAVVVASPNMTHASVLDDVLTTDLHVLVEKPMCTTVADCPNCFLMLGPNLYAFSSAFVMIEAQLDYVMSALGEARKRGLATLALKPGPLAAFNAELQAALGTTVFNTGGCTSYFIDRTGRNSTNWPWTVTRLRRRLRRIDLDDYETTPAR